jgi:hypothetical protein
MVKGYRICHSASRMKYCTWFLQLLADIMFGNLPYCLHRITMKIDVYRQQEVIANFIMFVLSQFDVSLLQPFVQLYHIIL